MGAPLGTQPLNGWVEEKNAAILLLHLRISIGFFRYSSKSKQLWSYITLSAWLRALSLRILERTLHVFWDWREAEHRNIYNWSMLIIWILADICSGIEIDIDWHTKLWMILRHSSLGGGDYVHYGSCHPTTLPSGQARVPPKNLHHFRCLRYGTRTVYGAVVPWCHLESRCQAPGFSTKYSTRFRCP